MVEQIGAEFPTGTLSVAQSKPPVWSCSRQRGQCPVGAMYFERKKKAEKKNILYNHVGNRRDGNWAGLLCAVSGLGVLLFSQKAKPCSRGGGARVGWPFCDSFLGSTIFSLSSHDEASQLCSAAL